MYRERKGFVPLPVSEFADLRPSLFSAGRSKIGIKFAYPYHVFPKVNIFF